MTSKNRRSLFKPDTFLCARKGTRIEKYFDSDQSVSFVKEKFFNLDKISGSGEIFLQIDGQTIDKELENDAIWVNLFALVAFEPGLEPNMEEIRRVQSMHHEEDTQFVLLAGTGRYWLQTTTLQHLIHRISPFVFEPPLEEDPALPDEELRDEGENDEDFRLDELDLEEDNS
ncbi:MAG: AIM24 family protein [Bacteroidia bacterium]|nr:AIM24 family protein [Bacteroidia bacterium]